MKERNVYKTQIILQNLLKEERRKRGISQKDLAKATGFTQSIISKYEASERRLDIIELIIVCEALEVSLLSFIMELEERIKESCNHET